MSFSELTFVFLFLPVAIIPYIILPKAWQEKVRDVLLLIINIGFYFLFGFRTLFTFLFIIFLTYMLGNLVYLTKEREPRNKKWIITAVVLISMLLVYFKLNQEITDFINGIGLYGLQFSSIAAPLGVSFLIFESISYVVDIYRGEATPGSFPDTLLFLSLFPKLLSGPIVQWKDFQPQISDRRILPENISGGIDRIIIGYAKKVILADCFGSMISTINDGILSTGVDTPTLWLKYILYFFQIYYDFSGYSDIAIGLCRIYGFNIKENFNFPYLSKSITEFWRRWHISLGTWFREYVYIPLGGNRKGNVYLHLMIVFVLTGIWHGIGLPFLIWGILNGIIVVVERMIRNQRWYQKIPGILKWAVTIIMLFFLWMVFSAEELGDLAHTIQQMFTGTTAKGLNFTWEYYLTNRAVFLLVIASLGAVAGIFKDNKHITSIQNKTGVMIAKKAILILIFAIDILYMVNRSYSPFMYFRF